VFGDDLGNQVVRYGGPVATHRLLAFTSNASEDPMASSSGSDSLRICHDLFATSKLVPFIGAGLSARFNIPSWSQLIDLIANELGWDAEVFKLSGTFLQLAEYYVAVKGSIGPLRSKMDKLFNPADDQILASKSHMKLVDLGFPLIYTTNFDEIIERSFKLRGKVFRTIASIDDIQEAPSDVAQIVKFHGTFSDDKSLVVTETNYFDRLDFESPLDIKLRADMLGKSLLFIGYSFSDLNIRLMLYKLSKLRREHKLSERLPTAIMTSFGPTEVERELLAKWDVLIVELDPIDRDRSMDGLWEKLG